MNEVLHCLLTRRSVKKYLSQPVEKEKLDAVLEAGTYAATGMGKQSPVIVVVQKPELIAKTVRKAVTRRRPHTRYLVGFGAKPMVWTHRIFGDRVYDWVIRNFS